MDNAHITGEPSAPPNVEDPTKKQRHSRKGYNVALATTFTILARSDPDVLEQGCVQMDVWEDTTLLHFLKTLTYLSGFSVLEKVRVYKRAKGLRWLAHNLYKLQSRGVTIQLVSQLANGVNLDTRLHQNMGNFGSQSVIHTLKIWI